MNTLPDGDLRPSTRDRQRDELIAILENESRTPHRRRLVVPLAAAAAVALVVGLALAVPALRHDPAAPAGDPSRGAIPAVKTSAIEPLGATELAEIGQKCLANWSLNRAVQSRVVEGYRAVQPPADAYATTWVRVYGAGAWAGCGYNQAGQQVSGTGVSGNQPIYGAVQPAPAPGSGLYAKSVARITVTPLGGAPIEASLRNGFYYAVVSQVRVRGPRTDQTPRPYVVRGYDRTGAVIYTSARTDGEVRAARDACYLAPTGNKLVAWQSSNPHPDPATCRRTVAWNWPSR